MKQNVGAGGYSMLEVDAGLRSGQSSAAAVADDSSHSPSSTSEPRRGRKLTLFAAALLVAASLGFWLGSSSSYDVKASVLAVLQWMGQPQLQIYESAYGLGDQSSANQMADFLLFVDESDQADRDAYLVAMGIEVKGPTIFPNAVVVSLSSTSKRAADALRDQPFTWMLVRDRPFFFCH